MTLPAGVTDVFRVWKESGHIQLRAGEMTAQELRSVKAVVQAIESEITAALAGRVVVPREPTQRMIEAGEETFVSGYSGAPISTPSSVYRAMLAAVDGEG